MKKRATGTRKKEAARLDQLRAVAHPLRLRMLELFTQGARTTKQVAELLGEPPTKLYHHANALERAGLLKLARTRRNRGAVEKWYVAAMGTVSGRRLSESRPMKQAISGLAAVALEESRREVELALRKPDGPRPLVMRLTAFGDEHRIAEIRKSIHQLVKELRDQKGETRREDKDAQRWTLTISFAPAGHTR